MTIAEELNDLKSRVSAAYIACDEKGATIPEIQNTSNLPNCIRSIPSGGEDVYCKILQGDEIIDEYICNATHLKNYAFVVGGTTTTYSSLQPKIKHLILPECLSTSTGLIQRNQTIESIYAPEMLHIGNSQFQYCTNLSSVYMPNLTSFGTGCFTGTTKQIDFYANVYGVLTASNFLNNIQYHLTAIPSGQILQFSTASSSCPSSLTFHDDIYEIKDNGQFKSSALKKIIFKCKEAIGPNHNCLFSIDNNETSVILENLEVLSCNLLIQYSSSYGVSTGVKCGYLSAPKLKSAISLDSRDFIFCAHDGINNTVKSIDLPNLEILSSNTNSDGASFAYLTKLSSINLPKLNNANTVKRLFCRCESLTEIDLPSLSAIRLDNIFTECQSLSSISFGSQVLSFSHELLHPIFSSTPALKKLTFKQNTVTRFQYGNSISSEFRDNIEALNNLSVFVKPEILNDYKSDQYWSVISDQIYPIQ